MSALFTKTDKSEKEVNKVKKIASCPKGIFSGKIVRPVITEKAHFLADRGVYMFFVGIHAGKLDIKRAIESDYDVSVKKVRTLVGKQKKRRFGKVLGTTKRMKKALVTLQSGQKIDLFQEKR